MAISNRTWIFRKFVNPCQIMKNERCDISFLFHKLTDHTRGDQKVRGKMLLNCNAFIDCNENS